MDLLQRLRRFLGRILPPPPPSLPQEEELPGEVKLSSVCPAILRVAISVDRQVKYHGYAMVGADGELVPGSFVITGMSPDGS